MDGEPLVVRLLLFCVMAGGPHAPPCPGQAMQDPTPAERGTWAQWVAVICCLLLLMLAFLTVVAHACVSTCKHERTVQAEVGWRQAPLAPTCGLPAALAKPERLHTPVVQQPNFCSSRRAGARCQLLPDWQSRTSSILGRLSAYLMLHCIAVFKLR